MASDPVARDGAVAGDDAEALAEVLTRALYETETSGGWWGHPECEEFGRLVAPQLAAHVRAALCSQCGEMPPVMVKVGTSDGWCESCLDEAADTAHRAERDALAARLAKVEAYRDSLARSHREYMRLHARSPKIAIATVVDRLRAVLAVPGQHEGGEET